MYIVETPRKGPVGLVTTGQLKRVARLGGFSLP